MFDWQVILVVCALLLACIYVGWRGWLRLSSFARSRRMNASSCSEGCGNCGTQQPTKEAQPANLVQIPKSQSASRGLEERLHSS
jgi:hypothetical protein